MGEPVSAGLGFEVDIKGWTTLFLNSARSGLLLEELGFLEVLWRDDRAGVFADEFGAQGSRLPLGVLVGDGLVEACSP